MYVTIFLSSFARAASTLSLTWKQWFLGGLDTRTSVDQWQTKLEKLFFKLLRMSQFAGLENSNLNFSGSSFVIRVNLLHP